MAALRVLGPIEVVDAGGSSISLAPQCRRLLAALTTRAGQVASADWLIEALWETEPPVTPEAALQTLVSRLRQALRGIGGVVIATRPGGYQLQVEPEALDVLQWQELLQRAGEQATESARAEVLGQALALWRGPAYADYVDAQFAQPEAARLSEQRTTAVEDWAELLGRADQAGTTLGPLSELVRDHPFRERPARLLMLAQYRLGRTAESLTTFQDLRTRLADELGLDPSPEVVALQTQILNNDPRLDPPAAPDREPRLRATSLPRVELIGREVDARELVDTLRRGRLVTVVGPGGVGKTSLVASVLASLGDAYADGSAVVALSRVPVGSSVAAALCTALRLPAAQDQDQDAQLVGFLADREFLLTIDNCEHVLPEVAAVVGRVLAAADRVTVLATSRSPLRLPGEEVFALGPLEVRAVDSTDPVGPAVQLFCTRARQRVRGFTPGPAELADIVELCARLDGLPLAIELAASQMGALTPADLVARLQWRLTVLHGGAATDPRHRTLGALVDWSFHRLTAAEQELFTILSVFAGEFTLTDVESLVQRLQPVHAGDPGQLLASMSSLVEHSMVTRRRPGSAFVLLETIRTYGRQVLTTSPEAESVARAHAELYAARAADDFDDLYGASHITRVRRLEYAVDELRAAFRWARQYDLAVAAELVGGLAPLVEHRLLGEISDWAEDLLNRLGDHDVPRLARVCAVAAAGARFAGRLDRTAALAARAVELSGDDATAAAYGYSLLGEAGFLAGDLHQAEASRTKIAELAAQHDHLQPLLGMADCLRLLAAAYGGDTDVPAAARDLQHQAERRGWPVVAAWALYVRGEVLGERDPARADALLTEALARARDLDELYLSGVALVAAASARARHGDPTAAIDQFIEVVRHWRDRGDWTHQWTTLRNVVDLLVRLGRPEPAVVLTAALLAPDRAATGYGADAARLAATAQALAEGMEPSRHADLVGQGRSLTDHDLVSFTLSALAAVSDGDSAVQPIEPEEAEVLDRQH